MASAGHRGRVEEAEAAAAAQVAERLGAARGERAADKGGQGAGAGWGVGGALRRVLEAGERLEGWESVWIEAGSSLRARVAGGWEGVVRNPVDALLLCLLLVAVSYLACSRDERGVVAL